VKAGGKGESETPFSEWMMSGRLPYYPNKRKKLALFFSDSVLIVIFATKVFNEKKNI